MDHHAWDERYVADDLVWSAGPNVFVAEVAGELPPGRALDLACGEGRNAIWLAGRGWSVTAVDFSAVAVGKARRLAGREGVVVDWRCEDVVAWEPEAASFDLVLVSYLHLPEEAMARVFEHARRALAPGGSLLVVGRAGEPRRGDRRAAGPAILYEPEDVVAWMADLDVLRSELAVRHVDSGDGARQALDTLVLARRGDAPGRPSP